MTLLPQVDNQVNNNNSKALTNKNPSENLKNELILCSHCQRTANNGIKCKGICISDNDY